MMKPPGFGFTFRPTLLWKIEAFVSDIRIPPVTLDLTINVPVVIALIGGIAAGSAAYATVVQRLEALEGRTINLPQIETQLARIDERREAGRDALARIEQRLDKVDP